MRFALALLALGGCPKKDVPAWVGNPYAGFDAAQVICADASSELGSADMARNDAELTAKARLAEAISVHVERELTRQGADSSTLAATTRSAVDQTLVGARFDTVHFYPDAVAPKKTFVHGCVPIDSATSAVAAVAVAGPRDGVPDLQAPLETKRQAEADAAVVIGIEEYFSLPKVPYAKRDADAFYKLLVYSLGVKQENVGLLHGTPGKEAIDTAVSAAIDQVDDGGTLWLYFAGHGAASPTDGQRLLLGADVQGEASSLEARGVPLDDVVARARGSKAARVMVVVDACYAGVGRDGKDLLPGKRFAVPAYAAKSDGKVAIWSATSANELSGPLAPVQQGLFTTFVVGGLRGWADGALDGKRDGTITLEEADAYVKASVGTLSNQSQKPDLAGDDTARTWALIDANGLEKAPDLTALR